MGKITEKKNTTSMTTSKKIFFEAFKLMCTAKTLAEKYEEKSCQPFGETRFLQLFYILRVLWEFREVSFHFD